MEPTPRPLARDQLTSWDEQVQRYQHSVKVFHRAVLCWTSRTASPAPLKTVPFNGAKPRLVAVGTFAHDGNDLAAAPPSAQALTPRQREIARHIAGGLTNQQMASRLVITPGTVANHIEHILTRLGFRCRAQVAAWAVQNDLLNCQREGEPS